MASLSQLGEDVSRNWAEVSAQVADACRGAGRDPGEVRILPVSKTVPVEVLHDAALLGMTEFGENRVQEAKAKWEAFQGWPEIPQPRWAIIGHLQTNKAKFVAQFASEFQALDSLEVAEALDRRLQVAGRGLTVLVQVNTSGEASKSGAQPEGVEQLVRGLAAYSALTVRGFMTIATNVKDIDETRRCFRKLARIRDDATEYAPNGMQLDELSMGMSGDFSTAIEEGATCVRIGSAIFGARPPRPQVTS